MKYWICFSFSPVQIKAYYSLSVSLDILMGFSIFVSVLCRAILGSFGLISKSETSLSETTEDNFRNRLDEGLRCSASKSLSSLIAIGFVILVAVLRHGVRLVIKGLTSSSEFFVFFVVCGNSSSLSDSDDVTGAILRFTPEVILPDGALIMDGDDESSPDA